MSERKPATIEVLKVEVKGENFAKAQVRCLDTGETSWHPFYRKKYRPAEGEDPRTDAERLVVPKARLKVAYQYKEGRAKGDGTSYPSEWVIQDVERLADWSDAAQVFQNSPSLAPESRAQAVQPSYPSQDTPRPPQAPQNGSMTERDRSIIAQVAWKCAAQLAQAHYSAVGQEEFDINLPGKWARDIARDIVSMTNDPFLWP